MCGIIRGNGKHEMMSTIEVGSSRWETFDSFSGETPTGIHFILIHEVRCVSKTNAVVKLHRVRVESCPSGWPHQETFEGENAWQQACFFMEELKDFLMWSEHPEACDCENTGTF